MNKIFELAAKIGSSLVSLVLFLITAAIAIYFFGSWLSLFIWCLPLTLSAIFALLVVPKFTGNEAGKKTGLFVSACASISFLWSFFVLEANIEKLPIWLLFILAIPLDSPEDAGPNSFLMSHLRGVIVMISFFGVISFISILFEYRKPTKTITPEHANNLNELNDMS